MKAKSYFFVGEIFGVRRKGIANIIRIFLVFFITFTITGCFSYKELQTANQQTVLNQRFKIVRQPQQQFYDLATGVQVRVNPTQPQLSSDGNIYSMTNSAVFHTPTIEYVKSMGFREISSGQDYVLNITLNKVDVNLWNGIVNVILGVKLADAAGSIVYSQEAAATVHSYHLPNALNDTYTQALEQINWVQIASFLKERKTTDKQVSGLGTTDLEQTIVRWDVQSRPQGADIFWRVVSKTPEVKSTNNKYLTTTPYEATKTLDIRGLTYQTAGNVRIILRCEKEGYLPQEKEYNVRMVLDQEEISAFFRLVKEN